jgi:hypothetical protein
MNPKPIEQAKSPLLARTLPALLRARKRAEELAAATNTSLVEVVNGKVVHVRPPSPVASGAAKYGRARAVSYATRTSIGTVNAVVHV